MTHASEGPDANGVRTLCLSGDVQEWPGGVRSVVDGQLLTVTLDRPKIKNAQTFATWASLAAIAANVPATVRVVLIRSQGPDFSAGLDLRILREHGVEGEGSMATVLSGSDAGAQAAIETFQQAFSRWRDLDAVVVAIVQGRAIGAGFQLALAADLRVAAADASFVMAEPRLGLIPDLGGTKRLIEVVGYARALDICVTSRPVDAAEALSWGLVNRVVPEDHDHPQHDDRPPIDDQLELAVQTLVDQICALPAAAIREVKGLLSDAAGRSEQEQLRSEREAQVRLLRGLDPSGH